MPKDHQHNPDPNENAVRIVRASTSTADEPAIDLEAAWLARARRIQ